MKFTIRLTLFLLVLTVLLPISQSLAITPEFSSIQSVPEYGTNLLQNGGFEHEINDTNWRVHSSNNMAITQTVYEATYVNSGTYAYQITAQELPGWGITGIHQHVPVHPGELYSLKTDLILYDINTVGAEVYSSLFTLQISFYNQFDQILGPYEYLDVNYPSIDSTYEYFEVFGIVPHEASYAKVELNMKARVEGGGGTVYIDNVTLAYYLAPTNLHASSKTSSTIDLSWDPVGDLSSFSHYEIYQDDQLKGTSSIPSFTATELKPTTAYTYKVKAISISSEASSPSNTLRVATTALPGYTSIMPLGDSLTHGRDVVGGYRYPLRDLLAADGLQVDFIGSQSIPLDTSDHEHEGHTGMRADQLFNEIVEQQVLIYEPDIVLLLTGTNDMFDPGQALSAHDDMDKIINLITSRLIHTHIVVASIPRILTDSTLMDPRVDHYNLQLQSIVEDYRDDFAKVHFVDLNSIITEDDMSSVDWIHLNSNGFNKISEVWHEIVHNIITDTTPPSTPILNAHSITTNSIKFDWTASLDNVAMDRYEFEIWQGDILLGNFTSIQTTYSAGGLLPNTEYSFMVRAIDSKGNLSISEPLTVRTLPSQQTNQSFSAPPPNLDDRLEYKTSDNLTILTYVPNVQKAIQALNDNIEALTITIPIGEPYDKLDLDLPSEIIKLATDKNKSIIISSGNSTLHLPPNFITVNTSDIIKLSILTSNNFSNDQLLSHSLTPRSPIFNFDLMINGKVSTTFNVPVQLTIVPASNGNAALSGIYLYNPITMTLTYVHGKSTNGSTITIPLPHFSQYALLESNKTFSDITNHWARQDIESLAAKQIVSGMTSELFDPKGAVTRAQFAAMIARALKLESNEGDLPFKDVSSDVWYYADISASYQAGIIHGITEDQFAPNELISREQMALMVVNAYSILRNTALDELVSTNITSFEDDDQISSWAQSYVNIAANLNFIHGMDGSFKPHLYADRAQAAAMINRLLQ